MTHATCSSPVHEIILRHHEGRWLFDDLDRDIFGEPFVDGMDEILDKLSGIPRSFDSQGRAKMTFSDRTAPQLTHELQRQEFMHGGYYYRLAGTDDRGWLCPVTMQYFASFPVSLFLRVEALDQT